MNDLIIFTSGAEWRVNAGTDSAFSAETIRQKPQTNWGISMLDPIVVGDKILYNTENGAYIRSIGYELVIDGYKGNDMTVFAPHIFEHYTAVDWAFARWPDPLIAVVRSDGYVAVLTFNPEQEVVAWSRWNTEGKFKRVTALRPSSAHVDTYHYFVVERKIGGSSAYYIERTHGRRFKDVRDCFFVDSGLSLDVPLDIASISLADPTSIGATSHGFIDGEKVDISDAEWVSDVDIHYNKTQPDQINNRRYLVADATTHTFSLVKTEDRVDILGVTQADPAVVTAPSHGKSDGDVVGIFSVVGMTELNGATYKVANSTDDTYELNTVAGAGVDSSAYTAYASGGVMYDAEDSTAMSVYIEGGKVRKVVTTLSNLWHLEGKEVVILADGNVISGKTIANGKVTPGEELSRAHVGLRYISDIETLNPEIVFRSGSIQGKNMRVPTVTVRFKDSRGLLMGPDKDSLSEMKQRKFEKWGEPTQLLTGDNEMEVESDWSTGGRMFLRQIHPLPITITAIIPNLEIGDTESDE